VELERALVEAEARFARSGRRLSPECRRVYERLLASPTPVKAYALVESLEDGGRAAYPATVYRALAALEQAGLVHRIASLNAFTACTGGDHGHAVAFMICERCGSAEEAPLPGDAPDPSAETGFKVRSSMTELRGFCRTCTGEA
jgi:Fur family zinc uptake transcriptional regulator